MKNLRFTIPLILLALTILVACNTDQEELPIVSTELFDLSGEDHSLLFDKSELKAAIINNLLSDDSTIKQSDLISLIKTDAIKVIKNNSNLFVLAEWSDHNNDQIGFISKIDNTKNDIVLFGSCTSRNCECTITSCSCLSEVGSCSRTWNPPGEEIEQ